MATDIMPMANTPLYCTHTVRRANKPACAGHSVSASSHRAVRPPISNQKVQVIFLIAFSLRVGRPAFCFFPWNTILGPGIEGAANLA